MGKSIAQQSDAIRVKAEPILIIAMVRVSDVQSEGHHLLVLSCRACRLGHPSRGRSCPGRSFLARPSLAPADATISTQTPRT
eukprot:2032987-Amphidinium_carterae.2